MAKDRLFVIGQEELLKALRKVVTLADQQPVYKNAQFSLETVDPNELHPTSKYVLNLNLRSVATIRERIRTEIGIDIYHHPIVVKGRLDEKRITVAPPFVEIWDNKSLIIDGIHRCYDSRENREKITIVIINPNTNIPPIGKPVTWEQVKRVDTQPQLGVDCRNLWDGIEDDPTILRKYYRDFSKFGSSGRRPRQRQKG